jgi:hypothetical protein
LPTNQRDPSGAEPINQKCFPTTLAIVATKSAAKAKSIGRRGAARHLAAQTARFHAARHAAENRNNPWPPNKSTAK